MRTIPSGLESTHLYRAQRAAAAAHARDDGYHFELATWSGRHALSDGVPAANATPPVATLGLDSVFAGAELEHAPGTSAGTDAGVLALLSTAADDRISQLRAGEATSAALLTATTLGLVCCPMTEPFEVRITRASVRTALLGDSAVPQILIRMGWAPHTADPVPATPRNPVADSIAMPQTSAERPLGTSGQPHP